MEHEKAQSYMNFNDWFENGARPGSVDAEFDRRLAKAAWNAAIKQATALVEERVDECEPWLTPDEMEKLEA